MESKNFLRRCLALGLFLLATPALLGAQVTGKKPLDHDAYDIWRSVGGTALSKNGSWIAFVTSPREGDGVLTLRSIGGGTPRVGEIERASGPRITPDSRFLVFTIDPMFSVVDSLEGEGKKGDDLPKDSLGIIQFSSAFASGGALDTGFFKTDRVKSWKMPADEGAYLAYVLEKAPAPPDSAAGGEEAPTERPAAAGRAGGARPAGARAGGGGEAGSEGDEKKKAEGDTLVFRDLASGQETRFVDVTDYTFTDDGSWLIYTASNKDGTADGIFAVTTSSAAATPILTGEGEYRATTLADAGDQVAFLTNRDDWEAKESAFTLYHAVLGAGEARPVATVGTPGIPEGWWVPTNASPSFSDSGARLFFGTAPRPPAEDDEEEVRDDEKVAVDIWSWTDPLIQPMQLVQANQRKEQTFLAYAATDGYQVVQLATEEIPSVRVGEGQDASLAVGMTDSYVKYGWYVSHDGTYRDIFLMDVATGEAEMVLEMLRGSASLSTGGKYLTWWDGTELAHMAMDVATREVRNLSGAIPVPVFNEIDDHPDDPGDYGTAGWLEGDEALLIYDQFDIWRVDPTGSRAPSNVTEGVGRTNNIRFRYVNLEPRAGGGGRGGGGGGDQGIDPQEDALLSAFHLYTKQDGFYRDRFDGNREPQRLIMGDYGYGNPTKAEDADVYVLTRSTFQEYGDLWLTDPDFRNMEKISNANPQQSEYVWGTAEILEWVSNDRIPLQGILLKPEGFDPTKKYPMMVYFYERSSDGLHQYRAPGAGGSVNPTFYVSRGYVFFIPDIPYEIGHPGESAIDAVVPGILKIVDMGFVDKDRIGVQGHSWGGYQIAYMITRSNIFAAAESGAPVVNMTSAYGGIRWGTGMNRQFQYERTQSRIGGSLWEETLRYIENSPLFELDKVQTPVLVLHNDNDDAVPWYQGIEMYMGLRRLQKPVWLINYNGEPHGIRKPQNQKDFTIRMQQFFDHYLKDAPAPVWMVEGVPAVMKGKALGLGMVGGGGN